MAARQSDQVVIALPTSALRTTRVAAGEVPAITGSAKQGADAATFLASTVDDARLAPSLTALRALADAVARVLPTADRSLRMVPSIRRLLARATRLLRISTRTQAATLSVLRDSAAIQRGTLSHVKSLDDKTLGRPPAALPGR